jgi:predicted hotdog family 3-hydroxylacyl-ACP dehydratase
VPEVDAESLPSLENVVPHAGPMLLLSRVLRHDDSATCCEIQLAEQTLFRRDDGRIPCWIGLEYMAQCIAAHAGLQAIRAGESPRVGFVMGSRRLRFHRPSHPPDGVLEVHARHLRGRVELGALSFACELRSPAATSDTGDGELLAEGTINIAIPRQNAPNQKGDAS